MTKQSTSSRGTRKAKVKPDKPYPDFPLFPHATGKWAKVIRGKTYYFGLWDEPQRALDEYLEVRDDLFAGRTPRANQDGLTLRELCNKFIHSKRIKLDTGNLSPRTFIDYDAVCRVIIDELGRTRACNYVQVAARCIAANLLPCIEFSVIARQNSTPHFTPRSPLLYPTELWARVGLDMSGHGRRSVYQSKFKCRRSRIYRCA